MKKVLLAVMLVFVVAVAVHAAPFNWDPETYAPRWNDAAPYARDIYLDFSANPAGGGPINGALYSGTLDNLLKGNDSASFTGSAGWDGSSMVGVAAGVFPAGGTFKVNIDELSATAPNWARRVWVEAVIVTSAGSTVEPIFLNTDGTANAFQDMGEHVDGGVTYRNVWFEMLPGGTYEELVIQFNAAAGGGFAYIDSLHVATEGTPEPATLALLGSGIVGLAAWRRRRSK